MFRRSALSLTRPRQWQCAFRTRRFQHSPAQTTPLEDLLHKNIKATGPISYATYMQFCLSHPTEGYYMKSSNAVFGPKGDFITSPDISQVFGELVAIWFLTQWQAAQCPSKIRLVELGPGRGALMNDMLRVISQLTKAMKTEVQVHLVETSVAMRELQKGKLQGTTEGVQDILWHDSLEEIAPSSDVYTMLVAHEFFDALPFHYLKRMEEGWHEVLINSESESAPVAPESGVDATATSASTAPASTAQNPAAPDSTNSPSPPRFTHVLTPAPTPISNVLGNSSPRFRDLPVGSFLEVSPAAFKTAYKIAELISRKSGEEEGSTVGCGGSALIIDYGKDQFFDNSRRAFKNHQIVDFFHRPGECDLTANVDFGYLREAMGGLVPTPPPLTQSHFLQAMGLKERLTRLLLQHKNDNEPEKARRIEEAGLRLVEPTGMGGQYSVLGVSSSGVGYPFNA